MMRLLSARGNSRNLLRGSFASSFPGSHKTANKPPAKSRGLNLKGFVADKRGIWEVVVDHWSWVAFAVLVLGALYFLVKRVIDAYGG